MAQVTSLYDKDATETKKLEIIEERKNEFYQETVEDWKEATEIEVYDKVWAKISLDGLKVTQVVPDTETDDKAGSPDETTE